MARKKARVRCPRARDSPHGNTIRRLAQVARLLRELKEKERLLAQSEASRKELEGKVAEARGEAKQRAAEVARMAEEATARRRAEGKGEKEREGLLRERDRVTRENEELKTKVRMGKRDDRGEEMESEEEGIDTMVKVRRRRRKLIECRGRRDYSQAAVIRAPKRSRGPVRTGGHCQDHFRSRYATRRRRSKRSSAVWTWNARRQTRRE